MKLNKKALTVLASALAALSMSMTAFAEVGYYEWYTSRYGDYPYLSDDDILSDPVYYQYLDEVYGSSSSYDDSDYYYDYYYDYDGTTYAYVDDAYWSGSTAKWSIVGKASKYQLRVYRNSTKLDTKTTKNKTCSLSSYITKEGYYSFQVRAYNKYSGWSDWEYSEEKYFSGSSSSSSDNDGAVYIIRESGPVVSPQWLQAADGSGKWWYRHADGGYTKSGWEQISNKWYYFDENGWMKTGWLNLNGATYYLGADGAMLTGYNVIDGVGHNFDSLGKMTS